MIVDQYWEMDHKAIDTQLVSIQEHPLMPVDNPKLQWLVSKVLQALSSSHWTILAKEFLWIQLPPWTFRLWGMIWSPRALDYGTVWSAPDLGSGSAWTGGAWSDSQNLLGWLTSGVWAVVMQLPLVHFATLEAEGMQWQGQYSSISLAVEAVEIVMTCPSVPGQHSVPLIGDPNRLLRCWIIRSHFQCPQFRHHQSPDH